MHDHTTARRRSGRYRLGLALLGVLTIAVAGACFSVPEKAGTGGNLSMYPTEADLAPGQTVAIEVANTATEAYEIRTVELRQKSGSDTFFIQESGTPCTVGTVLQSGQKCAVTVGFAAGSTSAGRVYLFVVIGTEPAGWAQARIDGHVNPAVQPAPAPTSPPAAPSISIHPTAQTFNASASGSGSASHTFTVAQTGAGTTGTLQATLTETPGNVGEFLITSDNCTGNTLQHDGDSCTVDVLYTNNTGLDANPDTADLAVSANPGGTVNASLTGNGVV